MSHMESHGNFSMKHLSSNKTYTRAFFENYKLNGQKWNQ